MAVAKVEKYRNGLTVTVDKVLMEAELLQPEYYSYNTCFDSHEIFDEGKSVRKMNLHYSVRTSGDRSNSRSFTMIVGWRRDGSSNAESDNLLGGKLHSTLRACAPCTGAQLARARKEKRARNIYHYVTVMESVTHCSRGGGRGRGSYSYGNRGWWRGRGRGGRGRGVIYGRGRRDTAAPSGHGSKHSQPEGTCMLYAQNCHFRFKCFRAFKVSSSYPNYPLLLCFSSMEEIPAK